MSASLLKIIALVFMVIDHIGYFFPASTPPWFRILGRVSFPIFMFLFIESYHYTSNRKKFFNRLITYSNVMIATNILILTISQKYSLDSYILDPFRPNIFLTFTLCFVILDFIERLRITNRITTICNNIFILLLLLTLSSFVEYNTYAIFMLFTFYFLRNKRIIRNIIFIIGSLVIPLLLNNPVQMAMVLAIIFITEYTGEKDVYKIKGTKTSKYFFYNFYALHILILSLLAFFI